MIARTTSRFGLGRLMEIYTRRQALAQLAEMDERQLADIGLTRFDVRRGRLIVRS